jgi:uncharacterized membrane protein YozB (DUF420 family)
MPDFFTTPGFLGTRATFYSDLTLILILLTMVLFTVGWQLAVHKKFSHHRWIQTSAVVINTAVILVVMIASFIIYIIPGIPSKLLEGNYGLTVVHAFVGTITMLLGVFIALRANGLVPKRFRFKNYKRFMRISYVLYLVAGVLGVFVYITTFMIPE